MVSQRKEWKLYPLGDKEDSFVLQRYNRGRAITAVPRVLEKKVPLKTNLIAQGHYKGVIEKKEVYQHIELKV